MTATRKPRPRRIAADEAHAWARNLRLGNPYAKLVLSMLTIYVNGEGACFVGASALAEDCELALETVRRRLAWLESIGALCRLPQWVDENGRRNGDGRGRRTTDEIRLMIDADPDEIEARAQGAQSDPDPLRDRGQEQGPQTASPPVTPSLRRGPDSLEPEPEDSPPNPPPGGDADGMQGKGSEGEILPDHTWSGSDTWFDFEKAWTEPILHQNRTRGVWSALTDDERQTALTAAKGYVAWRKAQRRPPNVINADRFLKERDAWPSFVQQAEKAETRAQQVRVAVDSREAKAWNNIRKLGAAGSVWESGGYCYLPRPLTPQELAFADLPASGWTFLESGLDVQKIGAWQEFFDDALKGITRGVVVRDHGVGTNQRRGCRMPWPWPPRKDGSLSTAPPQAIPA